MVLPFRASHNVSFSFLPPPPAGQPEPGNIECPVWALPFDTGDCGPDLEYDNAFLELQQAARGKPETQFEPATPPDWNAVETGSLVLLQKSRDLRLVVLWAESQLNLKGLSRLPEGLNAFAALLEAAWPSVNPQLDDGDPYARLNVVESLGFGGSFFQSLRNCVVVRNPRIGEIRLKDFEALTGNSPGTELPVVREQVEQFFRSPEGMAVELRSVVQASLGGMKRILAALTPHVDMDRLPQLPELKALLGYLQSCLPLPKMEQTTDAMPPSHLADSVVVGDQVASARQVGFNGAHGIQSRAQALAAIDQVCSYLEHAEPTNPAQLLLKRARRLIDKNFMQLMKDLAPEALAEVAKIMGVNPDSLEQEDA
ncbi:MAG: type VI secretion system ImpA family N-terminal domain-containing protein [Gammaproteobacteria bacterium]|uniref:type VI secretion system protein TssA n=1 Tax=Limnobacter sp. TaxID=2003368 RepID=UPI001D4D368F|nr:type VI secretion system ImpA family N-terminal domain-containing protein [Limnobacter sp.]MBU0784308.1 type VI secretion system ImpA family N-terminal domain-containing protein [Gammaproteobacteria bacterium]MBU0848465.1 type VI secretion system ImpA family N-terminal domain-containing protein [Gammaproteobacteria bacterium]MBU1267398.1 type VI secretion system ImpA family N-terminal domain-containing protein [Gammaproteobacteria bacterium]MBU1780326.1 type VI secretion system ImpA family N